MHLPMWYIHQKETCKFTIFYCIRMLQLRLWSIIQYHKHNVPSMRSSGPGLRNNLQNNVAVNRGERISYTKELEAQTENGKVRWMIQG
jgi:hypothetical protein